MFEHDVPGKRGVPKLWNGALQYSTFSAPVARNVALEYDVLVAT